MNKICVLLLVSYLSAVSFSANAEDRCSTLQNDLNTASRNTKDFRRRFNETATVWNDFCSGFRITEVCTKMLSVMGEPEVGMYEYKSRALFNSAARMGRMSVRELNSYKSLTKVLRDLNSSEVNSKRVSASLSAKIISTKCDKALSFMSMTDTALVSKATQKGAIGLCRIVSPKNSAKYSVLVNEVVYPSPGTSYSIISIFEMAETLRKALDAGLCKL